MTVLGVQNRRIVVLTATLPHLGVQALACLSATSRANRKAVREFIVQHSTGTVPADLVTMLKRSCQTARSMGMGTSSSYSPSSSGGSSSSSSVGSQSAAVNLKHAGLQHRQSLAWIARHVPSKHRSRLQVHQCLAIANAPAFLAQEMVAAGLVKVKLQHLLDAAGRRGDGGVPGVEVWVQAFRQLGMSSGLPALPVAICCSQLDAVREQLPDLPAKDWDDMLILAVNLLDAAVAEIMLDYIIPSGSSCSLDSGSKFKANGHCKNAVPPHSQHSPVLQQRLTPRLVRALLDTAVARRHTGVLERLCRSAAARTLSPMELARLLRCSVTVQHHGAIKPLLTCLREQTWTNHRTAFAGVLRVAIELHNNKALVVLCEQPAVQEFAALTVGGLVQSALRSSNGDAVPVLCGLPGAQDIHRAYLSLLLEAAVKGGHHQAVQVLSELPGNMTELEMLVPDGGMYSVMYTAIHQNRKQMVYHLCLSPAVQQLDPGSIAQLIEEAVGLRRGVMVRHLFWIEPAQLISTSTLARLLEVAIRAQDSVAVSCMCELDCMQQLGAEHLSGLLQLAVQLGDTASVCSLCQLRSARQVAASDVEDLLRACVQEQHQQESCSGVVCALCQLPAALSISAMSLCSLLKAAGKKGDIVLRRELENLCVQAGQGHDLVAAAAAVSIV